MYHHVKKLMYTVRVDEPDPVFGNMLLEQFGGANGELAAAMQYSIQGLNSLGSAELEKSGFTRYQYGSVHAPMPPMGFSIHTSDELWKIIAFIRSINPPGTNPPEKVIPGRMAAGAPH